VRSNRGCDDVECSGTKCDGYRGSLSQTIRGETCNKWHQNSIDANSDKGVGDDNYCRNYDGDLTIWCVTASGWDYCL